MSNLCRYYDYDYDLGVIIMSNEDNTNIGWVSTEQQPPNIILEQERGTSSTHAISLRDDASIVSNITVCTVYPYTPSHFCIHVYPSYFFPVLMHALFMQSSIQSNVSNQSHQTALTEDFNSPLRKQEHYHHHRKTIANKHKVALSETHAQSQYERYLYHYYYYQGLMEYQRISNATKQ